MTHTQRFIQLLSAEFGSAFKDIRADLKDNMNVPGFSFNPANAVGIAIHHTATGESQTWQDVNVWHTLGTADFKPEQWRNIAYAVGVSGDGVHLLRDLEQGGNHVYGHNHDLLSIAFLGTFTSKNPPATWVERAGRVIACYDKLLGKELPIKGHNQWALPGYGTTCPGPFLTQWAANFTRPADEPAEPPIREWSFLAADKVTYWTEQMARDFRDGKLEPTGGQEMHDLILSQVLPRLHELRAKAAK